MLERKRVDDRLAITVLSGDEDAGTLLGSLLEGFPAFPNLKRGLGVLADLHRQKRSLVSELVIQ